ncbi:hypothetical protein A3C87_01445 [Candidatus Kaiserbacteria bacterium RIFCSPHIGHO2_02_FULL_49_34]|uniref:Chromosome condensation regulator RCC1 n=1 Tax=Candidatus Kaiserbacteria bacterium RIFCSPHIGHO2_02_FULL_49_34 TaxID=1798491 RepID=A0A1F6DMS1_9BACT|nr:MAG: hypothetical protein A3C87_01445 [Candidatus Kaiserbacteria bacterium RIFCSPHIGHO2_02_FULL_49_34]
MAIPASGVKGACVGSNTIAIVAQAGAAVSAYLSKLAAGDVHSLAIKSNGALYAWGYNLYGRLGLGDTTNRTTPTQVGSDTNWSKIAAGDIFSLAIKTDGTLWTWGYNGYGQLGLGDTTLRSSPTQVGTATDWSSVVAGERHSFAIKTDGTLWAWGYNGHGQLGFGNTATGPTTPTQVGSDTNWSKIAAGQYYSHAIKTDGTLFSWGINGYGQLGLGDTTLRSSPTQVGIATDWSSVVAGERHSFAIKTDGTLYAWGYNGSGRLGLGDVTNRNVPTLVGTATDWSSATAGFDHSLAIKTDGTLWVWGYNANGRLGLGNTTAGPTSPVKVGTATDWSVVEGGGSHSLAIKTDGTILSWGYNATGQLGLNDTTQRTVPTSIPTLTLAILPTRERRNGIA